MEPLHISFTCPSKLALTTSSRFPRRMPTTQTTRQKAYNLKLKSISNVFLDLIGANVAGDCQLEVATDEQPFTLPMIALYLPEAHQIINNLFAETKLAFTTVL